MLAIAAIAGALTIVTLPTFLFHAYTSAPQAETDVFACGAAISFSVFIIAACAIS